MDTHGSTETEESPVTGDDVDSHAELKQICKQIHSGNQKDNPPGGATLRLADFINSVCKGDKGVTDHIARYFEHTHLYKFTTTNEFNQNSSAMNKKRMLLTYLKQHVKPRQKYKLAVHVRGGDAAPKPNGRYIKKYYTPTQKYTKSLKKINKHDIRHINVYSGYHLTFREKNFLQKLENGGLLEDKNHPIVASAIYAKQVVDIYRAGGYNVNFNCTSAEDDILEMAGHEFVIGSTGSYTTLMTMLANVCGSTIIKL